MNIIIVILKKQPILNWQHSKSNSFKCKTFAISHYIKTKLIEMKNNF